MSSKIKIAGKARRYQCADCHKRTVQSCFPTWYYEGNRYELQRIDVDKDATPSFYCDTCSDEPSDVIDHVKN